MAHRLRILHISDLHERVALDWMPPERKAKVRNGAAGRYRVFDEFKKTLPQLAPIDIVCFSGDAADWGLAEEYKLVTPRIKSILQLLNLPAERLYLIAGNHDVSRKASETAWEKLRELAMLNLDGLSRWMGGEGTPYGADASWREEIANRTAAFWQWVREDLSRPELDPSQGPHERLGYRAQVNGFNLPFPVYIIGLDSAWLCGDNHDTGKLALTKAQIDRLTTDHQGKPLPGFRVAMVHHPLTDLFDGNESRKLLTPERIDVLLRGHQHEPITEEFKNPDNSLLVLAAGSLYEGDQGDRWKNGFHVIEVELSDQGRPLCYNLEFWGWSPGGFWHPDSSIYRNAPEGKVSIPTALGQTSSQGSVETNLVDNSGSAPVQPAFASNPQPAKSQAISLNGQQLKQLQAALSSAFPNRNVLEQMVAYQLEVPLNQVAGNSNLADTIFELIGWAKSKGRLAELIIKAHDENPDNPELNAFVEQLGLKKNSEPPTQPKAVFVGRENELEELKALLASMAPRAAVVCNVQGMAGVGKSWLVEHFAARHRELFPAGMLALVLEANANLSADDLLGRLADRLEIKGSDGPLEARVVEALKAVRPLVHIENVDSEALARAAAGLVQRLAGVALVITGRFTGFRQDARWKVIPLRAFNTETGVQQLVEELSPAAKNRTSEEDQKQLVSALGGLPLAIHLAAGYLNAGYTAANFLQHLQAKGLSLEPIHANDADYAHRTQQALSATFELSWQLLKDQLASPKLEQAMCALGMAPRAGFGLELGAAVGGLDSFEANELMVKAGQFSLLEQVEDRNLAWRVHPLLAQYLQNLLEKADQEAAQQRLAEWFLQQMPKGDNQGERWKLLSSEREGLVEWLGGLPDPDAGDAASTGFAFAQANGPYRAWIMAAARALEKASDKQKSSLWWVEGILSASLGELDRALECASQKEALGLRLGEEREVALARGLRADILQARGQLDEALQIRQEQELPVYEKLGATRDLLVGRANLAINYLMRGKPGDRTEAVRLLRLALEAARKMQIPEAEQIVGILRQIGEVP